MKPGQDGGRSSRQTVKLGVFDGSEDALRPCQIILILILPRPSSGPRRDESLQHDGDIYSGVPVERNHFTPNSHLNPRKPSSRFQEQIQDAEPVFHKV